jgi:hypothetical protein
MLDVVDMLVKSQIEDMKDILTFMTVYTTIIFFEFFFWLCASFVGNCGVSVSIRML